MPLSKQRIATGILLFAFSLLLVSCGSSQSSQNREALRFNPSLPQAYIEDPFNFSFVADGGQRPYRYNLNGTLPKGLTYSGGRISGTPTEKGTFELNATVEDGNLSSRAVKLTLAVSDTPPPQFSQFFPTAEQDSPFIYGIRIQARESRGFQIQVPLTDLRPTLDTLKAADGVLYVLRYNQERNVMDIDVAFTQPRTNFEALRLSIAPVADKKVRFASNGVLMALYDKNAKLVANFQPIERQTSEGKYKYEDLLALARNWGRGQAPQTPPAGQAPAAPSNPTATPATPTATPTTPAQTPATPTQPATPENPPAASTGTSNSSAEPATSPASAEPAQPAASTPEPAAPSSQPTPSTEQPTPPAETQTAQPTPPAQAPEQTTPSQPAQEQPATPPAQSQPTSPTPAQPAQAQTSPPATPAQTQTSSPTAQPTQGQPNSSTAQPSQAQQTQPAQSQQSQPAQGQPSQAAQKTDGDLNNDGLVDAKDLELLRASYSWANVGNPTPRANPNQPNPGQPGQNQPSQNPPTTPPAGNTGTGPGTT